MATRLLIADDEAHIRRLIEQTLEELEDQGVTDVRNPAGELFSGERVQEVVMAHRNASAAEIVQAIVEAAADHAKGSPPADDFTLFVVKRDSAA